MEAIPSRDGGEVAGFNTGHAGGCRKDTLPRTLQVARADFGSEY